MDRTKIAFLIVIVFFLLGLGLISTILDDQYMLISIVLIVVSMLPFFIRFELKRMQAREIVLIALLAAIAAVSRVPFAPLPSVQPTSFVIIVSGIVFGAESGFIIGAFAALVSNMFLMQGPWTPWQMFGWGMIGYTAGLLGSPNGIKGRLWLRLAFGFVWGFLFGWIMDTWVVLSQHNGGTALAIYVSSFYFDLAHALSNVFFLAVFAPGWIKILQRFKRKYGLLDEQGQ